MTEGTIFDIKRYALHDGPGIRTTVFFKGCPLRCWWCHNPEAWDVEGNDAGRAITVEALMAELSKDTLFYDESGGGITFSGGEPLMQPEFLRAALDACKSEELHTVVDTCGYADADVVESILDRVNLFLFDVKLMDDDQHVKYTGLSIGPILENLRAVAASGGRVIIRFPLIPGITDTEENIDRLSDFASSLQTIKDIHVLPFHEIAKGKYKRLQVTNAMEGIQPPGPESIMAVKSKFETRGFRVQIGG